ncbi:MAG: hypothetical protein IKO42_00555 [Opitutales bacterium]|nr:hypothetical protein [Opitutales bacterium]
MESVENSENLHGMHSHGEARRALISLKKLGEIAETLPDPGTYIDRSFFTKSGSVELKFERIKYVGADGKAEYRWSYCSRIVV